MLFLNIIYKNIKIIIIKYKNNHYSNIKIIIIKYKNK